MMLGRLRYRRTERQMDRETDGLRDRRTERQTGGLPEQYRSVHNCDMMHNEKFKLLKKSHTRMK